ncbi:MAG: hypothetical protein Q7U02_14935, partial [Desulfosalsimonadaceae bacterium]|nr:hypothetical protein [Desulfosalsimonadaceae bacterium]
MKNHIRTLFLLLAFGLLLLPSPLPAATRGDIKVWPLFYHASDPVSHEARTEVFWPLYVRHQTPDYTANQFLSFPQTFPTHYPNQYYLFWPFGGVRAGHGHDAWLFPILWSGANADNDKSHHAVFPLCYYGKNKADYSLNIALLQHNSWSPTSRFNAVFPILWSAASHSETGDSFDLGLLPLGWMSNNTYHCPENQSESRRGGLFLINWWSRFESAAEKKDGSDEKTITATDGVFPVFYRSSDMRSSKLRTDEENALWIFPYWQTNKIVHSSEPDAAFKTTDESRHVFFPLWWDNALREDQTLTFYRLMFPLWWHSGKTVNERPEASDRFLVPIGAHFYKKGYYETYNLLGPMFNRTENSMDRYIRYDAFFPLFSMTRGEKRSGGRFFPLFGWETQRGKYDNLWYMFPLGWDTESQEDDPGSIDSESFWALHQLEERPYTDIVAGSDSGPRCTMAFYPFYWSKRRADVQDTGSFPLFRYNTRRMNRDIETTTDLPLFLEEISTQTRDDIPVYTRQEYLFFILAWGRGEDYTLARFFPIFYYENTRSSLDVYSLVPPFSYETWKNSDTPGTHYHSDLSIPFGFLPVYSKSTRNDGADHITRKSWFFPFYKHSLDLSPKGQKEELSILWPLWNGEWQNDETRIRGMGGFTNFYEKDANGFVEQRILYRLFTRKTRSWFSELELMPFYAQQYNENGGGYWKFLGGLIGMENRDNQSYLRLCYFPIPLGASGETEEDMTPEQQNRHADLALTYLQHGRHDRAAIEFALAGNARADDPEFKTAAGETYLNTDVFDIGDELRSTMPVSLKFLGGKYETENKRGLKERLRELAIGYFESAIRLGADKPALLLKISQAYMDLEKPETALEKLAESDRLSPRFGTAMARLITLDRMKSKKPAGKSGADKDTHRIQRETVLKEIKNRYPASPSVFLYEADTFVTEETQNRIKPTNYDPFSEKVVKQLALYTHGSTLSPGWEEKGWLDE